jgi:TatA/E family protein of Tat protein translocase
MIEGILAPWHWIILVVVLLLIFGPSKLPGVASSIGKGISGVRKEIKDATADSAGVIRELKDLNPLSDIKPLSELDPLSSTEPTKPIDQTQEKPSDPPAISALGQGLMAASTLKNLAAAGGLKGMATAAAMKRVGSPSAMISKYLLDDDEPPVAEASEATLPEAESPLASKHD